VAAEIRLAIGKSRDRPCRRRSPAAPSRGRSLSRGRLSLSGWGSSDLDRFEDLRAGHTRNQKQNKNN
jgi:hypothetical protein